MRTVTTQASTPSRNDRPRYTLDDIAWIAAQITANADARRVAELRERVRLDRR